MPDTTNAPSPATSPEQRLRATLDAVGLRYEIRANRGGSPYAGFQLGAAGAKPLGVTAMLRGPVLQLTAHELLVAPASEPEMRAADQLNREWLLGRLYHQAERGAWEAATSVYLGEDAMVPAAIERALADLQHVAEPVRGAPTLAGVDTLELRERVSVAHARVPRAPVVVSMIDVETALSAMRITYRLADDGTRVLVRLAEPDGLELLVEMYRSDERFLHLRARRAVEAAMADDAAALTRIQRLNAGILVGVMLFVPDPPRLQHHAVLPLAWLRVDGRLISWLFDHAAAALNAS